MKTILTTIFAIAMMVFASNTNPAFANGEDIKCEFVDCSDPDNPRFPELTEVEEPDTEREVADSGEEGSTSAASASDQ